MLYKQTKNEKFMMAASKLRIHITQLQAGACILPISKEQIGSMPSTVDLPMGGGSGVYAEGAEHER